MKKLSVNKKENLQGGYAWSRTFTVNGEKLVLQANCAKNAGGFYNFKPNVFGGRGNGASIIHLTGGLGAIWGFCIPGLSISFAVDCREPGRPGGVFILPPLGC